MERGDRRHPYYYYKINKVGQDLSARWLLATSTGTPLIANPSSSSFIRSSYHFCYSVEFNVVSTDIMSNRTIPSGKYQVVRFLFYYNYIVNNDRYREHPNERLIPLCLLIFRDININRKTQVTSFRTKPLNTGTSCSCPAEGGKRRGLSGLVITRSTHTQKKVGFDRIIQIRANPLYPPCHDRRQAGARWLVLGYWHF